MVRDLPVRRHRFVVFTPYALAVLAAAPCVFVLARALLASRNTAYWDEVDSAIAFLLRLDAGVTVRGFVDQLFSITNEHRTVTSRLIFALSYWLTGTVNFTVIGIIGNLFIAGFGACLVAATQDGARRLRMALLAGAFLFQLEHYENFLWSGGSIDHFQVVFLVGAALLLLVRGTPLATAGAICCALGATFTLAHGLIVWICGALLLVQERRWRALGCWALVAAVAAAFFLHHFILNPGHHLGARTGDAVLRIGHYWLSLLGAPLALGNRTLSPWMGLALLALIGARQARPAAPRERWVLPLTLWAIGSLLMVAIGRADANGGTLHSRYYVLGALAWLLTLFVQFDDWFETDRPYRALVRALPLLVLFNIAANLKFMTEARTWEFVRDKATESFMAYAQDGVGPYALHPDPKYATEVLQRAETQNVYRMPRLLERREFPDIRRVEGLSYYFDYIKVDGSMVHINGWAGFPGRKMKPGQIHLVLQSASQRIYTTLSEKRPDVVGAFPNEQWHDSGFHFRRRRSLLPPTTYQIGLLIHSERGAELIMTAHSVDLRGEGRGIIAQAP
jgi:hypothetical protein